MLKIKPESYKDFVTAHDVEVENQQLIIPAGTKLVDLFPDGILVYGKGDVWAIASATSKASE